VTASVASLEARRGDSRADAAAAPSPTARRSAALGEYADGGEDGDGASTATSAAFIHPSSPHPAAAAAAAAAVPAGPTAGHDGTVAAGGGVAVLALNRSSGGGAAALTAPPATAAPPPPLRTPPPPESRSSPHAAWATVSRTDEDLVAIGPHPRYPFAPAPAPATPRRAVQGAGVAVAGILAPGAAGGAGPAGPSSSPRPPGPTSAFVLRRIGSPAGLDDRRPASPSGAAYSAAWMAVAPSLLPPGGAAGVTSAAAAMEAAAGTAAAAAAEAVSAAGGGAPFLEVRWSARGTAGSPSNAVSHVSLSALEYADSEESSPTGGSPHGPPPGADSAPPAQPPSAPHPAPDWAMAMGRRR
jgi:translation initiation factor IF-2